MSEAMDEAGDIRNTNGMQLRNFVFLSHVCNFATLVIRNPHQSRLLLCIERSSVALAVWPNGEGSPRTPNPYFHALHDLLEWNGGVTMLQVRHRATSVTLWCRQAHFHRSHATGALHLTRPPRRHLYRCDSIWTLIHAIAEPF